MNPTAPRTLRGSTLSAATTAAALGVVGALVCVVVALIGGDSAQVISVAAAATVLTVTGAAAAGAGTARTLRSFRSSLSFDGGLHIDPAVCRVTEFHELVSRAAEADRVFDAQTRTTSKLEALHLRSAAEGDRMAQETAVRLHDDVLQVVIAARFQLETQGPEGCAEWLERAEAELRAVAFGLSPSIAAGGLSGALHGLCERRSSDGCTVEFTDSSDGDLPAAMTHTLLRAAAECISNAQRWGAASEVRLTLAVDDEHAQLTVTDNGSGFDPEVHSDGFGLFALRTEVAALGGTTTVTSSMGHGAVVSVELPVSTPPATSEPVEATVPAGVSVEP